MSYRINQSVQTG